MLATVTNLCQKVFLKHLIDFREIQGNIYLLGKITFLISLALSEVYPFVGGNSYLQNVKFSVNILPSQV